MEEEYANKRTQGGDLRFVGCVDKIGPGTEEEVELRACSVHAVEKMRELITLHAILVSFFAGSESLNAIEQDIKTILLILEALAPLDLSGWIASVGT
ncbi:hypothetical protein JHK85_043348 [Glycine max]|nr:hypothetical protein JHK85_043348 [Glycine max]